MTPEAGLMDREEIVRMVQATVAEALELEPEKVAADSAIIEDLGAESVDLLDLVFRLERRFKIRIPRGGVEKSLRRDLASAVSKGRLTEEGLEALRKAMPEVKPDRIQPGLRAKDIPRLFTVETFAKLVVQQLSEAKSAVPVSEPVESGESSVARMMRRAGFGRGRKTGN